MAGPVRAPQSADPPRWNVARLEKKSPTSSAAVTALMKPSIGMLRVMTLISAAGQEHLHARQLMGIRANLSLCR